VLLPTVLRKDEVQLLQQGARLSFAVCPALCLVQQFEYGGINAKPLWDAG
jgi:hypothetical protein